MESFKSCLLIRCSSREKANLKYDEELLYVSALFHDLGLTKKFSSPDKRFEVDGANAARSFLQQHGMDNESIRLVWDSIALHTTIGIAEYKEPQVSLIYSGVGYDVMGMDMTKFQRKFASKLYLLSLEIISNKNPSCFP